MLLDIIQMLLNDKGVPKIERDNISFIHHLIYYKYKKLT